MLALLPDDGPTGCYFDQTEMVNVWWSDWMACRFAVCIHDHINTSTHGQMFSWLRACDMICWSSWCSFHMFFCCCFFPVPTWNNFSVFVFLNTNKELPSSKSQSDWMLKKKLLMLLCWDWINTHSIVDD
jgi:hypothetical protein